MSDATISPQQPDVSPASSDRAQLTYSPNVDIADTERGVTLIADVPGARPDEIDIRFEDGVLTLHAPVAARELPGQTLRREYGVGDYRRRFRLGEGFDPSQITAEARNGVLAIHVPRLAAARPRKIPVKAN